MHAFLMHCILKIDLVNQFAYIRCVEHCWMYLVLIHEPSYIYKRWRGKIQGVREKNFRKIKITQKLDF